MTDIYGAHALAYTEGGWDAVLPLPPAKKFHPPTGYTGGTDRVPTDAEMADWRETRADGNIALRMPDGVVGIDVDAYAGKQGAETIAAYERLWGALPETPMSSARTDGVSGIRFFRVPPGMAWPSSLGVPITGGVEVIRRAHRYAVAPPSIHPDGGTYTWSCGSIPSVADLAELPARWVTGLTAEAVVHTRAARGDADALIASLDDGPPADYVVAIGKRFAEDLESTEDRHGTMVRATMDLARAAVQGASGVPTTMAGARSVWVAATSESRGADFDRAWHGAVRKAIAEHAEHAALKFDAPTPQEVAPPGPPWEALGIPLFAREELGSLPQPEPLIDNVLDRGTLAFLAGSHGTGKSFIAMGWAASVATGMDWLGRGAERGKVLYLMGEGASGVHQRLTAWETETGITLPPRDYFDVLAGAVQLGNAEQVEALAELVAAKGYTLVVVDTLARAMAGMDENSSKDAGLAVAALDRVRLSSPQCTVLVVHHTRKDASTFRGSSALEGAADTVYAVAKSAEGVVKLNRTKRKDGPGEDFHRLELVPRGESAVMRRAEVANVVEDGLALRDRAWLTLAGIYPSRRTTFTKAQAVQHLAEGAGGQQGIPASTSRYRAFADLADRGAVEQVGTSAQFRLNRDRASLAGLPLAGFDLDVGEEGAAGVF